jgi:hypothetical protein
VSALLATPAGQVVLAGQATLAGMAGAVMRWGTKNSILVRGGQSLNQGGELLPVRPAWGGVSTRVKAVDSVAAYVESQAGLNG